MKPPERKKDFEKVKIGEFINGRIVNIEYDQEHKFTYKGETKTHPAARLIFDLDGYAHKHMTRWMAFNYGEKANLYNKYLVKLVENAKPDMDFDLDDLKGMAVKTLWQEQNDFQSIESIFPIGNKLRTKEVISEELKQADSPVESIEPNEDLPF